MSYGGYIERLSRKVEARLTDIEAVFNFDLGDEFEIGMCRLLENVLPGKYGVCRGFVIAEDGTHAGDDLIIYDKMASPTLRASGELQYAAKEQIPIEAVYAYIECKHSISEDAVFLKALEQVRNVKKLLLSRTAKENLNYQADGFIFNGKVRDWPRAWPARKNQPFCAIFARRSNGVMPALVAQDAYTPDLLVLGPDHIGTQSILLGPDGIKSALFLDDKYWAGLRVEAAKGKGFGLGLVALMQALSWIELLPIDWTDTLNGAFASILVDKKEMGA